MKARFGFVSNSSSSSFVVCRKMITDEAFFAIADAAAKAQDADTCGETYFTVDKDYIHGRITYHDESGFWDVIKDHAPQGTYSTGD